MFEMKEYHLRYENGKLKYAEKDPQIRRWNNAFDEPRNEFGEKLQELIRQLTEKFPNKTIDVKVTSW